MAFKMKTIDGIKNSATLYIDEMIKLRKFMGTEKNVEILRYKLWKKTIQKYRILVIRNKISYSALKQCLGVHELFLTTIRKCYDKFI